MSYLALYRKYRPQTFDDIVGQEHITKTLINQIKTGRVGHAYLFCGSRGTGKTTTARIFARAINCLSPKNGSPCGECEVCKALKNGEQFDIVEIDAASNNGVDDARELREAVNFMPVSCRKKVFIIDEVHMLSTSAFNALLKTLEEPPEHVVFILGTTEIQKIPATILSRLMRFDFHLLSVAEIEHVLTKILEQDGVAYDADAISMVARSGEGSMRDSISLLDSCLSYSPEKLTTNSVVAVLGAVGREDVLRLVDGACTGDVKQVIKSLDDLLVGGKSPLVVSREIMSMLRDLLVAEALGPSGKQMVQANEETYEKMIESAKKIGKNALLKMVSGLGDIESELRLSVHPRLVLEMALFRVMGALSPLPEFEVPVQGAHPTTKPELDAALTIVKKTTKNNNILGDLLQFLRKNGKMALVAACSDFEKTDFENGILKIKTNAETKELVESRLSDFDEFFKQNGVLKVEFVAAVESTASVNEKIQRMRAFFGSKLVVED